MSEAEGVTERVLSEEMEGVIPEATWPEALPHPEEEHFLSVVCQPDWLWWALHAKVEGENFFRITTIWKSHGNRLDETIADGNGMAETIVEGNLTLSGFLPNLVHDTFMGPPDQRQKAGDAAILAWSLMKRIPAWTVYVIHSAPEQAASESKALRLIFSTIPCRMYSLTWKDFLPEQPMTEHLSLASVSSLKAILFDIQRDDPPHHPAVLLLRPDESVFTYAATDENGALLGEGMWPGWTLQLRSLMEHTGLYETADVDVDVENIKWEVLLKDCIERQEPNSSNSRARCIPLFSPNSDDALISGLLYSFYGALHTIVNLWQGQCFQKTKKRYHKNNNNKCIIWIDGVHGQLVHGLFESEQPLVEGSTILQQPLAIFTDVIEKRHLAHDGIGTVVLQMQEKDWAAEYLRLDKILIGQRILHEGKMGTIVEACALRRLQQDASPFSFYFYRVHYDCNGEYGEINVRDIPVSLQNYCNKMETNSDNNEMVAIHGQLLKKKQSDALAAREVTLKEIQQIESTPPSSLKRPQPENKENDQHPAKKHNQKNHAAALEASLNALSPGARREAAAAEAIADDSAVAMKKKSFAGRRVAKHFDGVLYFGTIEYWSPASMNEDNVDLWRVRYDDDDQEDYEKEDLDRYLSLYERNKKDDPYFGQS